MKYYLHDSNSFNDEKISELFIEFGYEGLGLFYTILEKLALQEKPVKTIVLKSQLKVGKKLEKCWNFMESLELISSNNGETFNKQLLNNGEKYQIKKEKNAKKIKDWRENQAVKENVTGSEPECNPPKVNKSKVNKIKVNKKEYKEKVFLSEMEMEKLLIELESDTDEALEILSNYKMSSGKNYKSDYHAIIGWVKTKINKEKNGTGQKQSGSADRQKRVDSVSKLHDNARAILDHYESQNSSTGD